MQLIDTHAHLDDEQLAPELEEVLARAAEAGVRQVIGIGTTAVDSAAYVALAARFAGVYAAVGIQPNNTAEAAAGDWEQVLALATRTGVVAIGETGLDRYWDRAPFAIQQDYFDRHLRLAQQLDLPFIVHTRESDADVLAMLREARQRGPLAGVMHSFTGTAETAAECLSLGMYVSFAGMVTFKKSVELRQVAATIPADRILVETDAPYLAPQPVRGKRNEPAFVRHTAECLALTRGVDLADFAAQTTENARRLFRLPLLGSHA